MTPSRFQKWMLVFKERQLANFLLTFLYEGYLEETGWIKSYKLQKPVGPDNQPLPWVTYSFIDFISPRLDKTMVILEYGSGNSTTFYSQRVKQVHSVEHDQAWYQQVSAQLPPNVSLHYVDLQTDGDYARFAVASHSAFDVIIVDGRDRVNCVKHSVSSLSPRGVLVLDDSERQEYSDGITLMVQQGFKRIDFWGIAPGIFYKKCTSLFYRDGNCIGI